MKFSHFLLCLLATRSESLATSELPPIANTLAYVPDQHDCPLPCHVDYANVHKWTPYFSVGRLKRCKLPMLLYFSAVRSLEDPATDVLIRSCTIGAAADVPRDRTITNATSIPINNPKHDKILFAPSLNAAPACAVEGHETSAELQMVTTGVPQTPEGSGNAELAVKLVGGMKDFFQTEDNCDETFLFAWHQATVASIYVGPGLGKRTVTYVLEAVTKQLETMESSSVFTNRTVAQLCDSFRGPGTIFGLSIDTDGDITALQKTALAWSRGTCDTTLDGDDHVESGAITMREQLPIKVYDIGSAPLTGETGNNTSTNATLWQRATCRYLRVELGDGCASLSAKCGIRGADFLKYNPKSNLCSTLQPEDYVCCSQGDPYTEPKPQAPQPNPDGSCAVHLLQTGDTCDKLARIYGLTIAEIESFNKGTTWGWNECKDMLAGYYVCLSKGQPPLPTPQQGTECGPMVPGTVRDSSKAMDEYNPCPLNACCSNWGFCGPFPAHCDIHAPEGGGPGSKLPGFQSTCISNCGNEIQQNSGPPAVFSRIGYYESWNLGRECLWLKAENANTDGSYTHIHWGFAEIDPTTWTVVLKDPHNQWQSFKSLTDVKKIVSFGGWAYSTEPATYNIIRQAIITHRETFATNAAKFIMDEGLDGIDIDWEYPGVCFRASMADCLLLACESR